MDNATHVFSFTFCKNLQLRYKPLNSFLDSNDAIRINRTRIDMGFSKMCGSLF